jgi:hypothetical protein
MKNMNGIKKIKYKMNNNEINNNINLSSSSS